MATNTERKFLGQAGTERIVATVKTLLTRLDANNLQGTVPVANGGVPSSTTDDNGKFLCVVDGEATWTTADTDEVILTDRTTGTSYIVYVDNGKLRMVESVDSGEDIVMTDRTTGVKYVLYVDNGSLTMAETVG